MLLLLLRFQPSRKFAPYLTDLLNKDLLPVYPSIYVESYQSDIYTTLVQTVVYARFSCCCGVVVYMGRAQSDPNECSSVRVLQ